MRAGRHANNRIERKRVKHEMSSLFRSKRSKSQKHVWRHKFCCLAYTDQDKSPTFEAEKEELYQAGLGEKEISFEDVDVSQEEFHEIIQSNFPRLRDSGGFRFLKGVYATCVLSTFAYFILEYFSFE